jgi:sulfite reductase beta subunit-like hemoprotein
MMTASADSTARAPDATHPMEHPMSTSTAHPAPMRDPNVGTDAGAGLDTNWVQMDEVEEFVSKTEAYQRGELDADTYRGYRLTRGVYGQRQDDVYMMRIKLPGGIVSSEQARLLAGVLDEAPLRFGNITTRTNLQVHHFPLEAVPPLKARLNAGGITQVDACGNAIRTVTQDPYAGLAPDEVFDTTPYMAAITRFFLNHPRARDLPRKFKIALSTSAADRALTAIHDVGLIATVGADGGPAFRVLVAGGLASMPQSGLELHSAWPARDAARDRRRHRAVDADAVVARAAERRRRQGQRLLRLVPLVGRADAQARARLRDPAL